MSKYKIIINKFNKIIKNLDLDDIELLNNVGRKESYLLYIDSFYSGFYYDVNKFNTFRIVNEKQFREIMLDEGEWILGKKYPEPFFKFKLNVGQVEGIYGNITMYIFSWNQYQY